jgi:putative FmdB family regulatory protein
MPFYEYECAACGHDHEAMQKMSDAPLKACPACGKPRLVRLISAPQFRLKGAGWYETDFKGTADAKRNLADSAEPAAKGDDVKEEKVRVKSSKLATGARKAASAVKQKRKKSAKQAPKVAKNAAQKAAKKKVAKKATKKKVAAKSLGQQKIAGQEKIRYPHKAARPK